MKAFPRDIEVQTLSDRHIGVESELGINGGNIERLPSGLEDKLQEKGLLQDIGFDGGGREFRTNPISCKSVLKQVRGRKYLEAYYIELSHHTTVLDSGGTHIHISILDSDHVNMEANAVALATAFYEQFQKISGRNTHWARSFGLETIDEVKNYLNARRIGDSRVYGIKGSMLGPTRHKTLEFRGPKGSNNIGEILAWIDFVNRVVEVANRESVDGVKFGDLIKGSYITEYVENLPRNRRLSERDLNRKLNVEQLT